MQAMPCPRVSAAICIGPSGERGCNEDSHRGWPLRSPVSLSNPLEDTEIVGPRQDERRLPDVGHRHPCCCQQRLRVGHCLPELLGELGAHLPVGSDPELAGHEQGSARGHFAGVGVDGADLIRHRPDGWGD